MILVHDNDILIENAEQSIIIAGENSLNITSGDNAMNIITGENSIDIQLYEKGAKGERGFDGRDYYIQQEQPNTNQDTYLWIETNEDKTIKTFWVETGA